MGLGSSPWLLGIAGVTAGIAVLCNLPVNPFVAKPVPATLPYLADTTLQAFEPTTRKFKARELWEKSGAVIVVVRRPGCLLCREEALELSALKPELTLRGVPLYAVVHESLGVQEFSPFFKGDGIFLDAERRFYGPVERWMFVSGFMRASVWKNIIRSWKKGIEGNLEGEGRILGGMFVVGPEEQGILYEYREKEFGDMANVSDILLAVRKIKEFSPS